MSEVSKRSDNRPTPPSNSAVVLLLKDIGDTTWRMFVPTIGLAVLGNLLDEKLGTKPWMLILGIGLGSIVTALLIKQLFKKL